MTSRHTAWQTAFVCLLGLGLAACNRSEAVGPSTASIKTKPTGAAVAEKKAPVAAALDEGSTSPFGELSLDKSEQQRLWELEHRSNVLVQYGFAALSTALKQADAKKLALVMHEDCVGRIPQQPINVSYKDPHLSATRSETGPSTLKTLTKDELFEHLLSFRQAFSRPPGVKFNVKLNSPLDENDVEGQWTSLCAMRLWGEGKTGPAEVSVIFRVRTLSPTKEAMKGTGWLLEWTTQEVVDTQAAAFVFHDVSEKLGAVPNKLYDLWKSQTKSQHSGGVYACDYNRDGCTDLLVIDLNPAANSLLAGRPDGSFEDVTEKVGLGALRKPPYPDIDAAIVDMNNDGWEDLLIMRGEVWRNVNGERFVNETRFSNFVGVTRGADYGLRDEIKGVCPADFDLDGLIDLYVFWNTPAPKSWLEEPKEGLARDQLLRNVGNWQFEDVAWRTKFETGYRLAFSGLWFDANRDRRPDLYVMHEFGDGALLINQEDGAFRKTDVSPQALDFGTMGAACGDYDNDGNIDLYLGSMYSKAGSRVMGNLRKDAYSPDVMKRLKRLISGSQFYANRGGLNFQPMGDDLRVHDVGWAWGPTLADFNNDGWLDLFATCGYISRDRKKPDG